MIRRLCRLQRQFCVKMRRSACAGDGARINLFPGDVPFNSMTVSFRGKTESFLLSQMHPGDNFGYLVADLSGNLLGDSRNQVGKTAKVYFDFTDSHLMVYGIDPYHAASLMCKRAM